MRLRRLLVFLALVLLLLPSAALAQTPPTRPLTSGPAWSITPALAVEATSEPATTHRVTTTTRPPLVSANDRTRVEQHRERRYRNWIPSGNPTAAKEPDANAPVAHLMDRQLSRQAELRPAAVPGADFAVFADKELSDAESGSRESSVLEPTAAQVDNLVLYTANRFAAVSTDAGRGFRFIDPATAFPNLFNGFCCDQTALYEPTRGLMLWTLLYLPDAAGNNAIRLAVARNQADAANGNWSSYLFTPQQLGSPFGSGYDYDFPRLTVGANHLYISLNIFQGNSFVTSVILRIELNQLASGASTITYQVLGGTASSLAVAAGGGATMYAAEHVGQTTLRIWRWPENQPSGGAQAADVGHPASPPFSPPTLRMTCPGPAANIDMCSRLDTRVMTGWLAGGRLFFLWQAAQGTGGLGTFAYPYLQGVDVSITATGVALVKNITFADQAFAVAFPSAGVNSRGHVGLTFSYSGRQNYPSTMIGLSDDVVGSVGDSFHIQPLWIGNSGVDRWGDYASATPVFGTAANPQINATSFLTTGYTIDNRCEGGSCAFNLIPRLAYIGRERDRGGLPVGIAPAPGPIASTWYFAEGYTGPGFDQYLTVQNPNPGPVTIDVTYYLTGAAPVVKSFDILGNARFTISVHDDTQGVGRNNGQGWPVSTRVTSRGGQGIIVERPIYFVYGPGFQGASDVLGANQLNTTWYFAEGFTGAQSGAYRFDEYLTMLNPNSSDGQATITYFLDGAAPETRVVPLPGNSRTTVIVHDPPSAGNPGGLGRNLAHSTRVQTSVPTVVERPMYFFYRSFFESEGGHNVMGSPTLRQSFYFPYGSTISNRNSIVADQYLTIMNPNPTAGLAKISYYGFTATVNDDGSLTVPDPIRQSDGAEIIRYITLPANSRTTVRVHDEASAENPGGLGRVSDLAIATKVETSLPTLVERPIYFDYKRGISNGIVAIGAEAPKRLWLFAEGYTGRQPDRAPNVTQPNWTDGYDQYFSPDLAIFNPHGRPIVVYITYQFPDPTQNRSLAVIVGNRSVYQFNLLDTPAPRGAGTNQAFSLKVESSDGAGIVVERTMYTLYRGAVATSGGHTAIGYAP